MDSGKDFASSFDMGQLDSSTEASLRERVKELTCLYGITQHIMQDHDSKDEIFQGIVQHIPPAWQYPDITVGRLVIDDQVYVTSGFKKVCDKQTSDIIINGEKRGVIEVIYTKRMPKDAEGPFLREERNLIDAIAKQITLVVERQNAEKEKKELEKQLIHADRLATIGQLAAGVAHELNEPLGNILGFAQLSLKCPELPGQAEQDIEKIVTASLYSREIIKKLLLFARQTPTFKAEVNINSIVSNGLSLFKGRYEKEGIELVTSLAPDLPLVTADPGQLNQVLVNLVVNSIQAMPEGGELEVKTYSDDGQVFFTVKDTGIGMSKEVQEQIFMPFYTTKDVDQGTGLGLAVVHGIVTLHGGSITVESEPDKGTQFIVRIPVNTQQESENERNV